MGHLVNISRFTVLDVDLIRWIGFRLAPDGVPLCASIDVMYHSTFVGTGIDALLLMQYIDDHFKGRFFHHESAATFPTARTGRTEETATVRTYYNLSIISSAHFRVEEDRIKEALVAWPDGYTTRFRDEQAAIVRTRINGNVQAHLRADDDVRETYESKYAELFPLYSPEPPEPNRLPNRPESINILNLTGAPPIEETPFGG